MGKACTYEGSTVLREKLGEAHMSWWGLVRHLQSEDLLTHLVVHGTVPISQRSIFISIWGWHKQCDGVLIVK